MTRRPLARTACTIRLKCGFSSGAPPVRSTTSTAGLASTSSITCSTTGSDMISVRFGPASTWQWWQA